MHMKTTVDSTLYIRNLVEVIKFSNHVTATANDLAGTKWIQI